MRVQSHVYLLLELSYDIVCLGTVHACLHVNVCFYVSLVANVSINKFLLRLRVRMYVYVHAFMLKSMCMFTRSTLVQNCAHVVFM